MLIITTDELTRYNSLPNVEGIWRQNGFLSLMPDIQAGNLTLNPVMPRMARSYPGFCLQPEEDGITVAIAKPDGTNYAVQNGRWVQATTPTFYSADLIRAELPKWVGPLQMKLRLQRGQDGRSPKLQQLKLAYEVDGELLAYCMESIVVPFLSAPVQLTRWHKTKPDGSLEIPYAFRADRMTNVQALVPETALVNGTVTGDPPRITLGQTFAQKNLKLSFHYRPNAVHGTGEYQFEEIPCLIARLMDGENFRSPMASDWIRMSPTMAKVWSAALMYDQPVEVRVVGRTLEDVMAIAQSVIQRIESTGYFDCPAYGLRIPVTIRAGIRMPDQLQGDGNLFNVTFRFVLRNLLQGESLRETPILTTIEKDFAPSP